VKTGRIFVKRIKENLSEQGILFSNHYVGDRLADDNEVYLFKRLIEKLDISAIINRYSSEGGSMFSPRDMLAVICYAFLKGITSSVQIADHILHDLRFIYLAGGHVIRRRTICDFRLKHVKAIKDIFISSIKLAVDSGLIKKDGIFALDGTKIEAHASFSKTRNKKEWEERQKKIIKHVDDFMQRWEEQDALEEDIEEERKKEFERIKEKLNKIKKTKDKDDNTTSSSGSSENESKAITMKNKIKIKEPEEAEKYLDEYNKINDLLDEYVKANDDTLLNLTDHDCRIMKNDGTTKECYNAQIISSNHIIVAADVTQDENDQKQLEPMVEQLKNNITQDNDKFKFAADAGYNSGKNLSYIDQEKNIDAYISMYDRSKEKEKDNKFYKEDFSYNEDEDWWLCKNDKKLHFMKEHFADGKKYTLYGCALSDCISCKDRDKCVLTKADTKRGYRTIDDDGYVIYRKEMIDKMENKKSKEIYSKRAGEVESVFGQIKYNKKFSRFRLQGLTKVKAEFSIMALAHNLGKIMKYGTFENAM
jgi:transposase